jgi:uncharacterized membrane protein
MKTLLAVVTLIQKINGRRLFQQALTSIAILIGLILITAIIIGALLIGSLIAAYSLLVEYGAPHHSAMLIIFVAAFFIIVILSMLMRWRLRRLREMPRSFITQSPLSACATDVFDAFLHGLMAE